MISSTSSAFSFEPNVAHQAAPGHRIAFTLLSTFMQDFRQGVSIREIAKRTTLSRNTIRRYLRNDVKEPVYPARKVATKLDRFAAQMREWLECDARLPRKQRRRATKLYQQLSELGYTGSYGRVAAFVRSWMRERGKATSQAYIPLYFSPGEAFQFDWSSESCEVGGVLMRLKVAQVRLCHSRKALAVAYPGESHEMLFDAHWRAFAYFGGVPRRGIYDNMSTAVLSHKRGEKPAFNKRFLAMASHYLFEPEACVALPQRKCYRADSLPHLKCYS